MFFWQQISAVHNRIAQTKSANARHNSARYVGKSSKNRRTRGQCFAGEWTRLKIPCNHMLSKQLSHLPQAWRRDLLSPLFNYKMCPCARLSKCPLELLK